MSITYPLTFPTHTGVASMTWTKRETVAVSESPFTYSRQVVRHAGQRWEGTITLPPMKRADAEIWNSFFLKLNGQFGTFLMSDPAGATAQGSASTAAGTPVVNGASQTGNSLNIDGLPTSETDYLKAGDYIQLGSGSSSRLYKVLDDVDTNASGQASLTIWPDLRSSPTDGASVVVNNAKGLFRLANNEYDFNVNNVSFYGISFAFVEAI